jgi:hypothetical protein
MEGIWLRVVLPFAGGYLLSYLYRTVNAVAGPVLAQEAYGWFVAGWRKELAEPAVTRPEAAGGLGAACAGATGRHTAAQPPSPCGH